MLYETTINKNHLKKSPSAQKKNQISPTARDSNQHTYCSLVIHSGETDVGRLSQIIDSLTVLEISHDAIIFQLLSIDTFEDYNIIV